MESTGEGTPSEQVGSGDEDVQPSGTPSESRQTADTGSGTDAPADAAAGTGNGPPEPGEEPSEGVDPTPDGDSA